MIRLICCCLVVSFSYRVTSAPQYDYNDYPTPYPVPNFGEYPGDYDEGEYRDGYGESWTPFGFLPTPVHDWLDKTVNGWLDAAKDIVNSKEKTVTEFVNKSLVEGEKVATKLIDDVMKKTEDNKHSFLSTISDVHEKLFAIPQSVLNICRN